MTGKRTIEVDDATADVLERRAAESGLSLSDLLREMLANQRAPAEISRAEIAELDRQWAAIKAGEPTVPHERVVRWLDSWGTPDFRPWNGR
jgi:predicted transcriptional regulator